MSTLTKVTVIGAGPYGLSVAAHLRGSGIDCRVIGNPMASWKNNMPRGMLLKSAGFSSNLSDPEQSFPLRRFCTSHGIPYADLDVPITLESFSDYGVAFQRRFVPDLEIEELVSLSPVSEGFDLSLKSGSSFRSSNVVIATGLTYFHYIPDLLARLSNDKLSHAGNHHDLQRFNGRRVAVIGSGASAIDTAVLLHEAQSEVQLISRQPNLVFSGRWGLHKHPVLGPMVHPVSGIGPGWKHRMFADFPWLFRYFPERYRRGTAEKFPSASGGEPMKNRLAPVPLLMGYSLHSVRLSGDHVQLTTVSLDGTKRIVEADHVIAATGYQADVYRFPFLSSTMCDRLRLIGKAPRLSPNFESSVPGLYFVGHVSAMTFGPVMRFVFGSHFTARQISRHLAKMAQRQETRTGAAQHHPTVGVSNA